MRNVEDVVIILFHSNLVNRILKEPLYYKNISAQKFEKLSSDRMKQYSGSERAALYEHLLEIYRETECIWHGWNDDVKAYVTWNVFDPLFVLADSLIIEENSELMCRYGQLLSWRKVTRLLGEDLLVTAFCAVQDAISGRLRKYFDWRLNIRNNNTNLNRLLAQGLADNHFHLWASAPVFQVSWICMMNDIENPKFAAAFQEMDENRRKQNTQYELGDQEESFALQHLQAVLIRLFLYSWLSENRIKLDDYWMSPSEAIYYIRPQIQNLLKKWEISCSKLTDSTDLVKGYYDFERCLRQERSIVICREVHEQINLFLQQPIAQKLFRRAMRERQPTVSFWDLLYDCMEEMNHIPLEWISPLFAEDVSNMLWWKATEKAMRRMICDEAAMLRSRGKIQRIIEGLKRTDIYTVSAWDYMLNQIENGLRSTDTVWYLMGERWFLYHMFRRMLMEPGNEIYYNWFYAYLVIQGNIRSEMVQVNQEVGLYNFVIYERRKGRFLPNPDWEALAVRMAVKNTLQAHDSCVKVLEARISPCNTAEENMEYITGLDDMIDPERQLRKRFCYVMHFIKEAEEISADIIAECRSSKIRERIRMQALALAVFREKFPSVAARVRGIDAASQEIGCRPEVFAQAFRFLRRHTVKSGYSTEERREPRMLGITYHVGEDFMDLVSGLRAIHEAVCFLNMDCGNRLGHALALGVDAKQWYSMKNHKILISQQDYLDNLAWLHGRITKSPVPELETLLHYIEKEFDGYFKNVYLKHMDCPGSYTIETYYNAWKLRSDNPYYYKSGRFCPPQLPEIGYDRYGINNKYPRTHQIRKIHEAAYLYHTYHFNHKVKLEGAKKIEITIPDIWIEGVKRVQKDMQHLIADYGISLETNPSSNYIIGTFRNYAKHPIIQWYNAHLTSDMKQQQECSQISVSINTDDQGIFSTSLDNEFALMACALEKEKDIDGNNVYSRNMIYEWLDEVRKMGLRQSFIYNEVNYPMVKRAENT